jgi:hypothetical protein
MTPEARDKWLRDLEWRLFHLERQNCRDEAEKRLRDNEVANIKREIELVTSDEIHFG